MAFDPRWVRMVVGDVVWVSQKSDLPAAVSNVITLTSSMAYFFLKSIDLGSDVIEGTDLVLLGIDKAVVTLQTTSTSPLVKITGGGAHLWGLTLLNDGSGGKALDVTAASGKTVTIDHCVINNQATDTIAGATGAMACVIRNSRWAGGVSGVSLSAAWNAVIMQTVGFMGLGNSADMLTLAAGLTTTVASFRGGQFITTHADQTALNIDSAIVPGTKGIIDGNTFSGPGDYLAAGEVDQMTLRWWFSENPGIKDSAIIGELDFNGNATETTITNGTSWHAVTPATWILSSMSERMDQPSNGQLRATGYDPKRMIVMYGLTIESPSNNKIANVRLRQYDASADTTSTIKEVEFDIRSFAHPLHKAHVAIVDLHENDYLFLEIGSDDGTNMTVLDAQLVANIA
jgi:hypothetical protein